MVLILELLSDVASTPGSGARHVFDSSGGTIGREIGNTWVLPHLAGCHAEVTYADGVFFIRNTSQYDVLLNSRVLLPGETRRLKPGDSLVVGPYELSVSLLDDDGLPPLADDFNWRNVLEGAGLSRPPRTPEPGEPASRATAVRRDETAEPTEEPDPLVLLNPPDDRSAPPHAPPTARDLDAGSPLDLHFRPPAIIPGRRSASPSPADPLAIPEDYDPLAPDDPFSSPVREGLLEFTAFCSQPVRVTSWQPFVVYIHTFAAREQVERDSGEFFAGAARPEGSRTRSRVGIREGAEIHVVPQVPHCEFNPPRASILWMEDWHRLSFRVRALPSPHVFHEGVVRFFVGPVLVGELFISVSGEDKAVTASHPSASHATAYQAVFVSYSHEDAMIVDQLQHAYSVLGIDYIRDVAVLRSGEAWNEAILAKIPSADVFQLCWSRAARASRYVEQEWRYALALQRRQFIRPMFWEMPMPPPPNELANLHFARLQWLQRDTP